MPPEAAGPDKTSGTWWTTLPGVLTGVAAVLGAIGTLLLTLHQVGLLSPSASTGQPSDLRPVDKGAKPEKKPSAQPDPVIVATAPVAAQIETVQVDGVRVTILGAQRRTERGASFLDVWYKVATGQDSADHYPASFIKLVSEGQAAPPVWTSSAPTRLDPNSQTEFAIKFPAPTDLSKKIVLRVGDNHPVELPVQVTE